MIIRGLSLVALAAWVATLWLPVLDSAQSLTTELEAPRIVITSLGGDRLDWGDSRPSFLLIWIGVLTCAISAWLVRSLRLWSCAAAVLGILILVLLMRMIGEPPTVMWDGADENGEWIGSMAIGVPAPGAACWVVGAIALIIAGICGFVGELRDRRSSSGRRRLEAASSTQAPGFLAHRAARLLPIVSLVAWVVMIWVPIISSGTPGVRDVDVTSLGRHPVDLSDLGATVLLPWAAILLCAVTVWFFDPLAWWSPIAALTGIVLFIMLFVMLVHPLTVEWDGVDSAGDPLGGIIVGRPADGASFWALGSGALVAAGILGFVGDRRALR